MFFVLKFELILIIGSNNVLTEGVRKVYRGRRVGQGCYRPVLLSQRTITHQQTRNCLAVINIESWAHMGARNQAKLASWLAVA
jgi:hypothetical protein